MDSGSASAGTSSAVTSDEPALVSSAGAGAGAGAGPGGGAGSVVVAGAAEVLPARAVASGSGPAVHHGGSAAAAAVPPTPAVDFQPRPVVECDTDSDGDFNYHADIPEALGPMAALELRMPFLSSDVATAVKQLDAFEALLAPYGPDAEFGFCFSFDPRIVDAAAARGIFPMALDIGKPVLAALLDRQRCVLPLESFHVSKTAHRAGSRFHFTVNTRFTDVMAECVRVHGSNWLFPRMRRAYAHMHRHPSKFRTAMVSVEVWQDGRMVAGEVGYVVGTVYTSLSGMHTVAHSGSAQLFALGALLRRVGVTVWDLGMVMAYKLERLGAVAMPRREWRALFAKHRGARLDVVDRLRTAVQRFGRPPTCREVMSGAVG